MGENVFAADLKIWTGESVKVKPKSQSSQRDEMGIVDWMLLAIGLSGVVVCVRGYSGADAISIMVLTMALALAIAALAVALKTLVDAVRTRAGPDATMAQPNERASPTRST